MRIQRILKWGSVLGIGTSCLVVLHKNKWEFTTIGLMRFGRTAFTVANIAADYKVSLHGVDKKSENYGKQMSEVHLRSANKLLNLCCANGGIFIKVGQHIGALDFLLPMEYVSTMKVLHNHAPKSSLDDVLSVLKHDFSKDLSDVFLSFDPEPIGSASLAQVHKAVLKDGTTVAVKVQHRHVFRHCAIDTATMEILVNIVSWLFPEFSCMWLVTETKRNLPKELDFVHEGQNAERVEKIFKHIKWLKVPKIYWDFTTSRVLTMEFCEGGFVNDKEYYKKHKIDPSQVSKMLGKMYSEMIFLQGYVHCDPHPGNILVNKTDEGTKIVLLDHGLYTTLTNKFRLQYGNLWMAVLRSDTEAIKFHGQEMGVGDLYGLLACIISGRSWSSIVRGIDKQQYTSNEGNMIKEYASSHLHLITKILNLVPREMLFILKTMDLLRGIETTLEVRGAASAFISIAECCAEAFYKEKLLECDNWSCWTRNHFSYQWTLVKLKIYQLQLWFYRSLVMMVVRDFWRRCFKTNSLALKYETLGY